MELTKNLLATLFPEKCIDCGILSTQPLCSGCRKKIQLSLQSIPGHHYLDSLITFCKYDGLIKHCLHLLKFEGYHHLAPLIRNTLDNEWRKLVDSALKNIDYIVPVPMHLEKKKQRRYNHVDLIFKPLCDTRYKALLSRYKKTPPLHSMGKALRTEMLSDAFCILSGGDVKNKKIAIVDDIVTTGATLSETAKLLRFNGAGSVIGITLCYTPLTKACRN